MTVQIPQNTKGRPMAVLGAGTLGRRIALMLATQGCEVRLFDPAAKIREAGLAYIHDQLPQLLAKRTDGKAGRVVAAEMLEGALSDVWLAIEAVPEKIELKKKIFGDLDRLAPADAILASNSSSYPTADFMDQVRNGARVLNTHFMMPPDINSVELMSNGETDDRIIELLMDAFPRYGLVPYRVMQQSVGFIFNRIWAAIKREALAVAAEGVATPETIDRIFQQNFETKAGPFRMMDQVGLDVVLNIEEHYAAVREGIPEGPRRLLHKMIDEGRLGVKSHNGFYSDYAH